MSDHGDVVSVERVIACSPEAIFDLIADPARHREIDGSGTVRESTSGSTRLALGSQFGMSMKLGVPYSMENTVVEFEENRRLAWQTRSGIGFVNRFATGRIWRYEIEPVDGGSLVRETWDISREAFLTKPIVRLAAAKTRENMAATLERIDQVVTSDR